jgi:hypothetical protein
MLSIPYRLSVVNTSFTCFPSNSQYLSKYFLKFCTHIYRVTTHVQIEIHLGIILMFPFLFTNLDNWKLSTNVQKLTSWIFCENLFSPSRAAACREERQTGKDKRREGSEFLIFLLKQSKCFTCWSDHILPCFIFENRRKVFVELVTV